MECCYQSPPLMNKNSTVSEIREQIQALVIRFLILGTPLTWAASLPPVIVAFQKYLINQTNSTCFKQPWNQIKFCPFHIHLHHHKISPTRCSSTSLQNQIPQSDPLLHPNRRTIAQVESDPFLGLFPRPYDPGLD